MNASLLAQVTTQRAAGMTIAAVMFIGAALVEHASKRNCDLIIVGDQREAIVARILLGSTSRHVLRQAQCSVLIVR